MQTTSDGWLLRQASLAAAWNAVLLPWISAANLAFSVLLRRRFGLFSGVYDTLLALLIYYGFNL